MTQITIAKYESRAYADVGSFHTYTVDKDESIGYTSDPMKYKYSVRMQLGVDFLAPNNDTVAVRYHTENALRQMHHVIYADVIQTLQEALALSTHDSRAVYATLSKLLNKINDPKYFFDKTKTETHY